MVVNVMICLELKKEMTSQALEYEGKIEQLEESLEGLGKSCKIVPNLGTVLKSNYHSAMSVSLGMAYITKSLNYKC
jgi:hypothetical protein